MKPARRCGLESSCIIMKKQVDQTVQTLPLELYNAFTKLHTKSNLINLTLL